MQRWLILTNFIEGHRSRREVILRNLLLELSRAFAVEGSARLLYHGQIDSFQPAHPMAKMLRHCQSNGL
jgi:hypothetical protein